MTKVEGEKLMKTEEAAEYLGVGTRTLSNWRTLGTGPAYVKLGRGKRCKVRYRYSDIVNYASRHVVTPKHRK